MTDMALVRKCDQSSLNTRCRTSVGLLCCVAAGLSGAEAQVGGCDGDALACKRETIGAPLATCGELRRISAASKAKIGHVGQATVDEPTASSSISSCITKRTSSPIGFTPSPARSASRSSGRGDSSRLLSPPLSQPDRLFGLEVLSRHLPKSAMGFSLG